MLEGSKRLHKSKDSRAPITEGTLTSIVGSLTQICTSEYETKLFKAAYLLTYHGLLRVSEVVFTTVFQKQKPLIRSDITFESDFKAVKIRIRMSKTNQTGQSTILRIPVAKDQNMCCVQALCNYLDVRPSDQIYLFCHANSLPLTQYQFSAVLSKTIKALGLPIQHYKTHSFRIGRATTLSAQGVPTEAIKKLGRWKSNCVSSYIRL